ncbi:MAG: YkgJ family cysteine cluster protein, partial [Desulfovibrionaceae bacterium]|nr:YkgJ family cysteine cluster protein [Desulfovibrionaceae bacterium]
MDTASQLNDESQAFLDALPELAEGETFVFACNESVPCFNRCCAELTLPLTPYDVLRLRRHMNNIDSEVFLQTYAEVRTFPETGFPLPLLKMQEGPGAPCPFVTPGGCSLYEDRPGACRTYPLGRGTKMGENGTVVGGVLIVGGAPGPGVDHGPPREARG